MYHLNWFQNFVVNHIARVKKFNTFDINKALKWNWDTAMQLGIQKGEKSKADCIVCPLYQESQRERETEKQMVYFQHHPGQYALYHKNMERQKFKTRKLNDPETQTMLNVLPPTL